MESYKICLIDLGRRNLTAGIALATLVGGLLLKKMAPEKNNFKYHKLYSSSYSRMRNTCLFMMKYS